jgi:hypothetical protein
VAGSAWDGKKAEEFITRKKTQFLKWSASVVKRALYLAQVRVGRSAACAKCVIAAFVVVFLVLVSKREIICDDTLCDGGYAAGREAASRSLEVGFSEAVMMADRLIASPEDLVGGWVWWVD